MLDSVNNIIRNSGGGGRKSCPVCDKSNVEAELFFYRDWHGMRAITPFLSYHVYACPSCGMVYAGNIEESMPISAYYKKMSRYEGNNFVLAPDIRSFYEREAAFLAKYIHRDAKILDIGCAFGGLLAALKDAGFSNLYGLEPSETNATYAQKVFGIEVYQGGLGIGKRLEQKFDLVILSEVLEHLWDLHTSIEEIHSYLQPHGNLFFAVPELRDFPHHIDLYQEFSIEHINYFSVPALENLMRRHSMKLSAMREDSIELYGLAGSSFTLWERGEAPHADFDVSFAPLKNYLAKCKSVATDIRVKLSEKKLLNGFYIWGAGTQTAMLYQLELLPRNAVHGIIDSNANIAGEQIYGQTIYTPFQLRELPTYPILISSQYAQQAIQAQIKKMELKNEVWTIF